MAKIVVVGGGSGLAVILRGLKEHSKTITALVTVADDGGGSGVLREDLGMLPPGDIRSCLLALSDKEPLLNELFQYRFDEGRLKGQSFGNLMIAAMNGISDSFEQAVEKISYILKITGEVLPVASTPATLKVELESGVVIRGESNIPLAAITKKSPVRRIWLEEPVEASPKVLERIADADSIIIGPGSHYTSVISALKVDNIVEAINNSKARIFYIVNIMTQPGETDNFSVKDHIVSIIKHTGIKRLDYVIINDSNISSTELEKYKLEGAKQSSFTKEDEIELQDFFEMQGMKCELLTGSYATINKGYIIHNAQDISDLILSKTQIVYE